MRRYQFDKDKKGNTCSGDYHPSELMAVAAAREIRDGEKVFIGIGVPMAAGLLAIHTHAPNAVLVFEGGYVGGIPPGACSTVADDALGYKSPYITSLFRIFCDLQRGYFDLAVIGGAQIDKFGNVNSTTIFGETGNYSQPIVRLPGSGGANDMASLAKRTVIVMKLEKGRFVSRVDYITSPGYLNGPGAREKIGLRGGGPAAVITDKAVFRFNDQTKEMYLASLHPGISIDEIINLVEWDLKISPTITTTEPPLKNEIKLLRALDPIGIMLRVNRNFENLDFNKWVSLTAEGWTIFQKLTEK
ncbi:MAG: CoA-transferase [Candidatus Micrarchaeia archaeon]